MMITELERYNFFTSRFYSAVDILCKNPPHVIFVSDLYGAATGYRPGYRSYPNHWTFPQRSKQCDTYCFYPPMELECMSAPEIDHWIQGASTVFNGWKVQLARTSNIGERTLLQEAIGENSYLPYLDEKTRPVSDSQLREGTSETAIYLC